MDYYQIGQRIRRFRKEKGLSQELLAEHVGISVTHMSHIETGNTKLSLPVFVRLAEVLEVPADALLYDVQSRDDAAKAALEQVWAGCTPQQRNILIEIVRAAKAALDQYAAKE